MTPTGGPPSHPGLDFWRTGQLTVTPEAWLRWARAQRLLLLLPWRARQRGWSLPEPLLAAARQEGYANAAWQARAWAALRMLGALAQAMDAPAVVVKGPLVAEAYPDPLLRPYGDLDLLIRPPDARRWLDALTARGYQPHVEGGRATHLPALLPPGPGPRIELHAGLSPDARFTWHAWGARTAPWPTAPGLLQPAPVDHWLYLVYHMVERHSLQFGLGALYDLAFLAAPWTPEEWLALLQRAEAQGMTRSVGLALALLRDMADEPPLGVPPAALAARFPAPPPTLLESCWRQLLRGWAGPTLPHLWRDLPDRSLRGWFRYLWLVVWGDPARLGPLSWTARLRYHLTRPFHLLGTYAPLLYRGLRRQGEASWQLQHELVEWLRG